jgi:hypothetical protein
MLDKIKAMSAPPGHSLTGEQGKWAWEQPPRFSDPNDAIDFITDKLEEAVPQEDMLKMILLNVLLVVKEHIGKIICKLDIFNLENIMQHDGMKLMYKYNVKLVMYLDMENNLFLEID